MVEQWQGGEGRLDQGRRDRLVVDGQIVKRQIVNVGERISDAEGGDSSKRTKPSRHHSYEDDPKAISVIGNRKV